MRNKSFALALLALLLTLGVALAAPRLVPPRGAVAAGPVGAGFTYQGQLKQNGGLVTAHCDVQFTLWDAETGGAQVGSLQQVDNVAVSAGLFTVRLNENGEFGGNAFAGQARWLAIAMRCPAGVGAFTPLAGRQPLTAVPYALYALAAGEAAGSAYAGVVVVAQSGGDFTSIQAALDSIAPAETQRYLVWVAPGVYTETVTMKPYVDIAGAGETLTRIVAPGAPVSTTATVRGADNAELRMVTVENTGGNAYAVAIYSGLASPRLSDVTARAAGGNANIAVYLDTSDATLSYVDARAAGGARAAGVHVTLGAPSLLHVTAGAAGAPVSYGAYAENAAPVMTDVTLTATATLAAYGLYDTASTPQLSQVTSSASGGTTAYGIYNVASEPALHGVTATAGGATQANYGVYNDGSTPWLAGVTAEASGGTNSYGVYNRASQPSLDDVTATAAGATNNYGVYNDLSAATFQACTVTAEGGTLNYGIYNAGTGGPFPVLINHCQVTGSTRTVRNDAGFITRAGASQLSGGAAGGGGTLTCAGVYDENYVFGAGPACP